MSNKSAILALELASALNLKIELKNVILSARWTRKRTEAQYLASLGQPPLLAIAAVTAFMRQNDGQSYDRDHIQAGTSRLFR
jgi:hypothetical protein